MRQFELRFLDRLDVVILARAYTSHDDLGALEEAERLCTTHTIEIWEGTRRVARVKKGNAAFNPEDRICG